MSAMLIQENMKLLFGKVVNSELDELVNDMVERDPKLLCRLNFKSPEVSSLVKSKLDSKEVHLGDLMAEPEDTFTRNVDVEEWLFLMDKTMEKKLIPTEVA